MKLQAVYSADYLSVINLGIMSATAGRYAHVRVLFTMRKADWALVSQWIPREVARGISADKDGRYRVYFESTSRTDERTGKNGVRGPYQFDEVIEWYDAGRRSVLGVRCRVRHLEIQNVPGLTKQDVIEAFKRCAAAVPDVRYSRLQILHNWRGLRLGRGIPFAKRSPRRWTCVELLMRVLPARLLVECLKLGEILFDEYAPSGRRGPGGAWELIQKVKVSDG